MHMNTIQLCFKMLRDCDAEGVLEFQITYDNKIRQVDTGFRIRPNEWDAERSNLLLPCIDNPRYAILYSICYHVKWEMKRFDLLANYFKKNQHSIEDVVNAFQERSASEISLFVLLRKRAEKLYSMGRTRCGEIMDSTLMSFMQFRNGVDLELSEITSDLLEQYEAYLKSRGVIRNTSSFYMRNLRSAYKLAVREGLTTDRQLFQNVYTGIDKTMKRAISVQDIRKIKSLDLSRHHALEFARDMLMFSLYTRGMSFVDMAYLCRKNVVNGYIIYRRKKTGQKLSIALVPEILEIISKYQTSTQYLLPIIVKEDGTERRQYKNQLIRINRHLKTIGMMVGISIPMSTYVTRHSWATIARDVGVSLPVISEGLGHDSETTTKVYLDSIQESKVDEANRLVLDNI